MSNIPLLARKWRTEHEGYGVRIIAAPGFTVAYCYTMQRKEEMIEIANNIVRLPELLEIEKKYNELKLK